VIEPFKRIRIASIPNSAMGSFFVDGDWIYYVKEMVGAFKMTMANIRTGVEVTMDNFEYPLELNGDVTQAIIFPRGASADRVECYGIVYLSEERLMIKLIKAGETSESYPVNPEFAPVISKIDGRFLLQYDQEHFAWFHSDLSEAVLRQDVIDAFHEQISQDESQMVPQGHQGFYNVETVVRTCGEMVAE
jgi:hypothetical protein